MDQIAVHSTAPAFQTLEVVLSSGLASPAHWVLTYPDLQAYMLENKRLFVAD